MFFGGKSTKRIDYSSRAGRAENEDLVRKLGEERKLRQDVAEELASVLKCQAVWRAHVDMKRARRSERGWFDGNIGLALQSSSDQFRLQLALSFAFFADSREPSDAQRVVLLGALFRDPSATVPSSLISPLLAILPALLSRPAPLAACIKLVSSSMAGDADIVFATLVRCGNFHRLVGACLRVPSMSDSFLKPAFLKLAVRPFFMNLTVSQSAARNQLCIEFTENILSISGLLVSQPPELLRLIASVVRLDSAAEISDDSVLNILGNLAALIAAQIFDLNILKSCTLLLRTPSVVQTVFPVQRHVSDSSESASDSDDEDFFENGEENGKLSSPTVLLLRSQLAELLVQSRVSQLFRMNSSDIDLEMSIADLYGTFLELWPEHADAIRNALAFQVPEVIPRLWERIVSDEANLKLFESSNLLISMPSNTWSANLRLFCEAFVRASSVRRAEVLSSDVLIRLVQILRPFVVQLYLNADPHLIRPWRFLIRTIQYLYDRDCRHSFVPVGLWIAPEVDTGSILRELAATRMTRSVERILSDIPFCIPFLTRVDILRQMILNDGGIHPGQYMAGVRVKIRRNHILEDGKEVFDALKKDNRLRERLRITFYNSEGLEEAGVDGGGVYKEFIADLVGEAFHQEGNSLFLETEHHKLYPNPAFSYSLEMYEFFGMVLGKALFENILVEIPLAPFFLSKLLGKTNTLDDLKSLDSSLYKSLCFVLSTNDVDSLGLSWSLSERNDDSGVVLERDLCPNGRNIPVTLANRVHYVYSVAHYKLNRSIRLQSRAFVRGFGRLIRPEAIKMFSESELQKLISGEDGPLNVAAWTRATQYGGGYHPSQPIIKDFWECVDSMTMEQQRKLLKFITSSQFAPLMGFDSYSPPITIGKRSGGDEFLPTASTCVNLLKLPEYSSKLIMRERLLYAIESAAGFELS